MVTYLLTIDVYVLKELMSFGSCPPSLSVTMYMCVCMYVSVCTKLSDEVCGSHMQTVEGPEFILTS